MLSGLKKSPIMLKFLILLYIGATTKLTVGQPNMVAIKKKKTRKVSIKLFLCRGFKFR